MRAPTWTIVLSAAVAALVLGAVFMARGGGWTVDGALEGVRITARWAFPWFILAWSASSLARLWPGGWRSALLRRRRAIGLAFAANHFVHLGFIVLAAGVFAMPLSPVSVIGGGITYAMIAAMAATSSDAAVRWMGRARWKILHAVGGWMVLLIFTNSYVGRLGEKPWLAIPAVGLIALALLVRVAATLKGRLSGPAAPATL